MLRYLRFVVPFLVGSVAQAQIPLALDASCTVSVGNQTALVRPDGTFFVRNISVFQSRDTGVAPQLYRARATCLRGGEMITGQSEFFSLMPGQTTVVAEILPSELDPIPVSISASAPAEFVPLGATVQINVLASLPDGSVEDVTLRSAGTTYLSTNTRLLTVSENGLVTGVNNDASPGTGTIAILNEGNLATIDFTAVGPSNDFDNDGMPNDYEDLFGLNKFVNDANGDLDGDGLTNIREFELGALPNNPDTDGDGVPDGLDGDPLHPEESPPTVTITSPADGATLIEGQTLDFSVDATDDGLLTGVEFLINGASLATATEFPFELIFTVPLKADSLTFEARATDSVDNVGMAQSTTLVIDDPLTIVQGIVVDSEDTPVDGADVSLKLSGLKADFFDFDIPLTTFADLTGLTPDATALISAVNLRNPDDLLSPDTFGVGFSPDFAARFTGLLRVPAGGIYTFVLGVDDGARLSIEGVQVVEIVAAGEFTTGTGAIGLSAGTLPVEIEYFQGVGDAELQLSVVGPGEVSDSVVPPADLFQSPDPFATSTGADGSFLVSEVPTNLGTIRAAAAAIIDGEELSGSSDSVVPVAGGVTDLGKIELQVPSGLRFVAGTSTDDLGAVFDATSPPALPPPEDLVPTSNGVIFTGDFLRIGVNAQGSLIFGGRGLQFAPSGNGLSFGPDVLDIGFDGDIWGARFDSGGASFFAFGGSNGFPNNGNVSVASFDVFQNGELSVARSVTTFGPLEVTTVTSLRRSDRVVFIDVTLSNIGAEPIENLLFSRSSDFDVNGRFGNSFDVFATDGGGTIISAGNPGLQFFGLAVSGNFSVADGISFANPDPLRFSNRDPDGAFGDFSGSFVFLFDTILPGLSVRLSDSLPTSLTAPLSIGTPEDYGPTPNETAPD